jgi:hypothetical protein
MFVNPGRMQSDRMLLPSVVIILLLLVGCTRSPTESEVRSDSPAPITEVPIPHSLIAEHEELHRMLKDVISSGGETGRAAGLIEKQLAAHFAKEAEYALPPLTMLPGLAQERSLSDPSEMIRRSERMKAELPQMLNEHKAIVLGLDELIQAARNENKETAVQFAEKLRLHARMEEEIFYPAGIVAGQYTKLCLAKGSERAVPLTGNVNNAEEPDVRK